MKGGGGGGGGGEDSLRGANVRAALQFGSLRLRGKRRSSMRFGASAGATAARWKNCRRMWRLTTRQSIDH
jgi:hypothetical protein